MYSKMEDFEIQSSDITFVHREFSIPCGMGPKEQFSNLCVPLAIQCSTIRHLGDDFRLDRVECPFIHVKGEVKYTKYIERGPDAAMIWNAHILRESAGVANDRPCELPQDLQRYANYLNRVIHVIEREAGNEVTYVCAPSTGCVMNHVYLYKAGDHMHGVQRPEKLLAHYKVRFSPLQGNYLCDFCYYSTKDLRLLKVHVAKCSRDGVALLRSEEDMIKSFYNSFRKRTFRVHSQMNANLEHGVMIVDV